MNKYLIIAASALALAGCSSDDFLGDGSGNGQNSAAIQFGGGTTKTHRATSTNTYDLAKLKDNGFWVYGTKHSADEDKTAVNDQPVYTNYYLNYTDGTANNTQSNTAGWEYVGVDNSQYRDNVTPNVTQAQTIKYWDYSAKAYTFYAATAKPDDVKAGNVKIEKITEDADAEGSVYTKGYEVTLKDGATWDELYFADRKVITKPTTPVTPSHGADDVYGGEVNFKFRNALTKVRVAMYETIPGYSVTIDRFYYTSGAAGDDQRTAETNMFKADASNTPLETSATGVTYKVVYYNKTEASGQLENQPKMLPNAAGQPGATKTVLALGNNLKRGTELSTDIQRPTYDTNGGNYTLFMPQADNNTTLSLKVDYTLTSLDGSGEKIYVKGATAVIPAKYLRWRPNYAYTYLFKISDNTNGSTGGKDDPAGLYPITFNASVVETAEGNVEYISAMGTATITTFAVKNKLYQHDKADYENGSDLYATVVEKDKSTVTLGTGNTKVYKLKDAAGEASEALVANWVANSKTNYYDEIVDATKISFVSTVPAEDGQTINLGTATALKIAGVEAGKYVIEYTANSPWTGAYSKIYKIVTVK